jgi:spermidine synthase
MSKRRKVRRDVAEVPRAAPVQAVATREPHVRYFAFLAFLSGTAALTYQVLWVRQLGLVVGVDVYAVTTCVSAFFAGLAVGSFFFGRRADHAQRPLRSYAVLEFGIACSAFAATIALAHAAPLFAYLQHTVGIFAWLLGFFLVGVPAFLIGGTLPLLFRTWGAQAHIPKGGGLLYAVNTAGGIAGALWTPFLLIPRFGIRGSALVAAALNLAVGCAALLSVRGQTETTSVPGESPETVPLEGMARFAMILYGIAGGVALGYEIVWTQAIVPFMSTRTFAFAVVLATYLAGLMVGSALYSRIADSLRDPWGTFAILISGAGLLSFVLVAGLGHWLLVVQTQAEALTFSITGSILAGMCARFAVAALSVVFMPMLLLGAAFPVVLKLAVGARHIGSELGNVLGYNTLGGILGTLISGFVLVPLLGLMRTLGVLAVIAASIGAVAVFRAHIKTPMIRYAVVFIAAVSLLLIVLVPRDRLAQALTVARGGGQVVFYQESAAGTVAVLQESRENGDFHRLYIEGVSNSGDAMPSLRYMRLQALLPLIISQQTPKSALVIGYGTGITSGALLAVDSLEKRVCVELLPGVVQASRFFRGNFSAANDPRLQIRMGDGRQELLRSRDRYDLITLEPPPPSAAGVANLYSSDFYHLAAQRLQPGGLVAQWLPIGAQNLEDSRALVRSFIDIFPYATLWTTELHEMLLVGSAQPIVLDADRIARRFHQPQIEAALREVGVASPAALLSTWVTDRAGLEKFAAGAAPVTDDRPSIEYGTWVRPAEIARALPELFASHSDPPVQSAGEEFQLSLRHEEQQLRDFYIAGLAAYRGERELWARSIQRVLASDGDNPYYIWSIGKRR